MTVRHGAGAPAKPSGCPALRRLVAVDPADFASRWWGREPLLTRASDLPPGFGDLLDEEAVDELLSRRGLRTPFLRVAKEGSTLSDRAFTAGGGVGAGIGDQVSDDKLVGLFAQGATLVLQGLHRLWAPLIELAQQLAADLAHPVQVNAYVTPPQSRGFDAHYDVHDVFVLQVAGRKRWRVHAPVHAAPLRHQPWTERRDAVSTAAQGEPVIDAELAAGDCLYLPRGYLHAATALGGVSTHVTVGVHTWTRFSLAEQLAAEALSRLAQDTDVRRALALGTAADDPVATGADLELVRSRLVEAVADVSPEVVASRLAPAVRAAQRAEPVGPLAAHRAEASLRAGDLLRLRHHLAAALDKAPDGSPVLHSRAGTLPLAAQDVSAVQALLDTGLATAEDLGLPLARRLLAAAVVVAVVMAEPSA